MNADSDLWGVFEVIITAITAYFIHLIVNALLNPYAAGMSPVVFFILNIGVDLVALIVWIGILQILIFKPIRDKKKNQR